MAPENWRYSTAQLSIFDIFYMAHHKLKCLQNSAGYYNFQSSPHKARVYSICLENTPAFSD
jgi:hypothetical protein